MRYLCRKLNLETELYPHKDLKRKAKVDMFLDWGMAMIRYSAAYLNMEPVEELECDTLFDEEAKIRREAELKGIIAKLDTMLEGKQYVTGEQLSVADIWFFAELYNSFSSLGLEWEKYERAGEWAKRITSNENLEILWSKT